ncbi:hypothetical protein TELCIR_21426 [Teladorsagia circumcincta]|uniref:Uncharacterized protein n=1 Tax=Teladorsagia circumcincta TaxID=45464 RepID=A0A2G9TIK7_TELCI|nr:hypothetical protein TELCIR_21426 [Teladorsagia circumcincta]
MLLVKPFYVRSLAKRGLPIPGGHGHGDDEDEEIQFCTVALQMRIYLRKYVANVVKVNLNTMVEFNSKFYGGTGVAFEPFYFTRLIRVAEGLEQ